MIETLKYKRLRTFLVIPEYLVTQDGKQLGMVLNMGNGWAANCKAEGCWCHLGYFPTRKAAAESLLTGPRGEA